MSGFTPNSPIPSPPNRRTYAVLALATAAFIVYGSLVPLEFRSRPLGEVVDAYTWAMTRRILIQSRVDGLTNILVGMPLGFALLAMSRVDRDEDRGRDVIVAVSWLPACLALGAAVEFIQLYLPTRTCSASDVICQVLGAGAGMAAWMFVGRQLTARARQLWGSTPGTSAASRLLVAYLVVLALLQTLPFDLSWGPKSLYHKIRDEARFVPFEEFRGTADKVWAAAAKCIEIAGLFLPLGLLAARLRGGIGERTPVLLALAFVTAIGAESLQVAVRSRHPAATDAIAAMAGIVGGWLLGRRFAAGLKLEAALLLGQVWAVALIVRFWQPFHDRMPPGSFDWLPGIPADSGNPLLTLFDFLCKLVLFAPFGVLVASAGPWRRCGAMLALAGLTGAAVAAVIEVGQLYVGARTPGLTDVLLGGCGAFIGAWIASRVA